MKLRLAPKALAEAKRIKTWWQANRPAAPDLFEQELDAALERIVTSDGLVRIALKKAFSDGTVAVDIDPLSLLSRLCASVPPPRFHAVRYAGVLGSASKLRARLAPKPPADAAVAPCVEDVADLPRRRPIAVG